MSYANPLHPMSVPASGHSYSLNGAAYSLSSSKFMAPNRRRVPQKPFSPRGGIPQNPQPTIYYDYPGFSHQGVPMKVFGAGDPPISGAWDVVFNKPSVTRITFHIIWPGYPHVEWYRSVEINTKSGPMTRAQLGYVVSGNFMRFIEKTQYDSINPSERPWLVGPNGIRFENLVLLSVWNAFENSWQAEVAVDF